MARHDEGHSARREQGAGRSGAAREGGRAQGGDRRWQDRGERKDFRGGDRREGGYRRDDRDSRGDRQDFRREDRDNRGGERREGGQRRWEDRGDRKDFRGGDRREGGFRRDDRDNRGGERKDFRGGARRDDRPQRDEYSRPGGDIRAANRDGRERSPEIDEDVTGKELDRAAQRELRYLEEKQRGWVTKHLVMAARLLEDDPELAFAHAEAASRRGGRLGVVREAAGITAYAAGRYQDALRELRTYRRISGDDQHLALIADCERALGRAEKALETTDLPEAKALSGAARAEVAIVRAGILTDLGRAEEAVTALEIPTLDLQRAYTFSPRLYEAYADALEAVGRDEESARWRARIAVAERALGLDQDEDPEIIDLGEDDDEELPTAAEALQGGDTSTPVHDGADVASDEPVEDATSSPSASEQASADDAEDAEATADVVTDGASIDGASTDDTAASASASGPAEQVSPDTSQETAERETAGATEESATAEPSTADRRSPGEDADGDLLPEGFDDPFAVPAGAQDAAQAGAQDDADGEDEPEQRA